MCFYSTYKELKHSAAFINADYKMGFYSTYKELKPTKEFEKTLKAGFYSTYKELKQRIFTETIC